MLDGEGGLRVVPREGLDDALRVRRVHELDIGKSGVQQVSEVVGVAVGDEHRPHCFSPKIGLDALLPHRRHRSNARSREVQGHFTLSGDEGLAGILPSPGVRGALRFASAGSRCEGADAAAVLDPLP